ncbi:hypothetical protein PgNI_05145 [Pyricularia grisea]|uniref:C2H2-type domain-containing protein n=1 Tax=Pyricularia grisea TaxID=148305 RepID=A0A6P8B7R0_PYRGI|nr:hypothetical protein PgNI_05145 [Pyricularia grisea]TLD11362.1 hypothetical protein PgNI_05145 [Pyricularia grisea]
MQLSKVVLAVAFYSVGIAAVPTRAKCTPVGSRSLQNTVTSNSGVEVNNGLRLKARGEDHYIQCGKCHQTFASVSGYLWHYTNCNGK